jgi:ABC-type nitrate/sulfonate/bicarbonate transport system ATPase subunit
VILTNNLSVSYTAGKQHIPALKSVNINIGTGEIHTFIGPSGCGKSTLLHVLSGTLNDYTGTASINGKAINPRTHRIGLIPQNYGLLPWKNVYENAMLGLKIKNNQKQFDEYSLFIIRQLELEKLLDRYPRELSGGQQQRVAIARAFILKPDLLLMDEPFSALDAITREEMQELFLDIWNQYQVTTIFITHSVDEALYLGGKITVFSYAPGTIISTIDNPCFRHKDFRYKEEYYSVSKTIRQLLEKGENHAH